MKIEEMSVASLALALGCCCVALLIALGVKHYQYLEVRQQNMKLELEVRNLTAQTNEITAQWLEMVKRIKNHEVTTR
jgi:uncharacterized protein HemX